MTARSLPTLPNPILAPAYRALQQGLSAFSLVHKTANSQVLQWLRPRSPKDEPLATEVLVLLQKRMGELLANDWQDVEDGIYPAEVAFDRPWEDFLRAYPLMCLDSAAIWERAGRDRGSHDFSPQLDTDGYPNYYLQNFHYQTDGYLSDHSADLYDLQVEILFNGGADAMRRRILRPIRQWVDRPASGANNARLRVLDVACGTGRSLRFLRGTLPKATLVGVDLSPAYLRKANQWLSQLPGELPQLIQANAEALPFVNDYFQVVTSTFLFHELPAAARRNVLAQLYRVLAPGGLLVICDSLQRQDVPELTPMLENFPQTFHEPYYRHYLEDDLGDRLTEAGFQDLITETHFVSKYWIAHKPLAA